MSIFGQVWLWSLLSFVAGVLLTWLILVRPVRKQALELEDQLARAQSVPPPPPPKAPPAEDFVVDEWEPAPSMADEVPVPRPDEAPDERPRSLHERLTPAEEPRVAPPYAPHAEVAPIDHQPMAPAEVDQQADDFVYQPREVWADQEAFADEAREEDDDPSYPATAAPETSDSSGEWPETDLTGEYADLKGQIQNRLGGPASSDATAVMEPASPSSDIDPDEQARLDEFHAQAHAASQAAAEAPAEVPAETESERTTVHEPVETASEQTAVHQPVEVPEETAAEQTLVQEPITDGWRPGAAYRPSDEELPVSLRRPVDDEAEYTEDASHAGSATAYRTEDADTAYRSEEFADGLPASLRPVDEPADEAHRPHEDDRYEQLVESAQAAAPEHTPDQTDHDQPWAADQLERDAAAPHDEQQAEQLWADQDHPDQSQLEQYWAQAEAAATQDQSETQHPQVHYAGADELANADFDEPDQPWSHQTAPDQEAAAEPTFTEPEQQHEPEPEAAPEQLTPEYEPTAEFAAHPEPEPKPTASAFNAFAKPTDDGHFTYEPFGSPTDTGAKTAFDPFAAVTPVDPNAEAFQQPLNGVKHEPEPAPPVVERPRSLFEPILEADGLPPLTETKRPELPPSSDEPFVPKFVPGPPLSEQAVEAPAPPEEPSDLPRRETSAGLPVREKRRSTPPRPFQAQPTPVAASQPAPTPSPVRNPRPRPVGFSPSTGGRGNGTTRFQQPEGFNPRSPFGPGSVLPKSDGLAPASDFEVKATLTGRRYYTQESANFIETRADVWFRTVADAQKAGFRPAP